MAEVSADDADGTRPVVRAAALTAVSNLVLPLTSLATAPILARSLGATGRGEMAAVIAPLFVLQAVANLGLIEATAYGIARLKQSSRVVLLHVSRLSLVYGVVASIGLWVLAPVLLRNAPGVVPLLRGLVWLLPLLMITALLRSAAVGIRAYGASAAERVSTPVLRLVSLVVLAVTGTLTVHSAAIVQVVTMSLGGLVLASTVLRRRRPESQPGPGPDQEQEPVAERPGLTRELAWFGLKGWGGTLGSLVNWRLDQVILVALVSPAQLGFYVVAVSLSEISLTMVNAIRNVLFVESAHRDSTELIARAARSILLLVVPAALIGAVAAHPFIHLLFGSEFGPSVRLAQVLLVATIPYAVEQALSAGLMAAGHPGMRSFGQIVAAVVTVAGLVVLAPLLGAMGAALTTLLAYSVNLAISAVQFHRVSGLAYRRLLVPNRRDLDWLADKGGAIRRRLRGSRTAA